jgi:hypothetical protein
VLDTSDGKRRLTLTTLNLSRVDVYLNGRPALSVDVHDGDTPIDVPQAAALTQVHLEGYDADELTVTRDLAVKP